MTLLALDFGVEASVYQIHAPPNSSLHPNVVFVSLQDLLVTELKLRPNGGVCRDIVLRPHAVKDYFAR